MSATPAWQSPAMTGRPQFRKEELEDDGSPGKLTITVFAVKDGGKSTQAFALRGPKFVIGLDGQSKNAKYNSLHRGNKDIHVFEAYRHYNETVPASAGVTIDYINWALDTLDYQPDWVIFDAFDILAEVAENFMRANHGLKRSDSFANKNLWKERKDVIRGLWRHALSVARLGVVFCTYYKEHVLARENGETTHSIKGPNWMDLIEHESSITVELEKEESKLAKKTVYRGVIFGCKFDEPDSPMGLVFKPGERFDLTDGKLLPWNERLAKFYALADKKPLDVPFHDQEVPAPTPRPVVVAPSKPNVTVTEEPPKKAAGKKKVADW